MWFLHTFTIYTFYRINRWKVSVLLKQCPEREDFIFDACVYMWLCFATKTTSCTSESQRPFEMETIGCFTTQRGFITQNTGLNRIFVLFHEINRLLWGSFFFFPYQYWSWIPFSHILVNSTIALCLQLFNWLGIIRPHPHGTFCQNHLLVFSWL